MKRRLFFFMFPLACASVLFAKDLDVVFVGITEGSAPAIEETLDRRVRENLSTFPDLAVTDFPQTQSFRRKIRFDEYPVVSRKLVESLKQYTADSTVFVWGAVKNCTFTGIRTQAIRAKIRGEIVLTLTIYSLRYKTYAFAGDVRAELEKNKGYIFFGDAEKDIIVSAADRSEMMKGLIDQAARKSASLIETVIQSERLHAAKEADVANVKSYEVPSLSDMFNMPSVEAASVSKVRKRPTAGVESLPPAGHTRPPANDTASSKKPTPPLPAVKKDTTLPASPAGPAIDTVKSKEKK